MEMADLVAISCHHKTMKSKPIEGKPALEEFTRTMQALFRVPKSAVEEPKHKPHKKAKKR